MTEIVEVETVLVKRERNLEMPEEESPEADPEVLRDADHDVTIEMTGTDLVAAGIAILFLYPRSRCILSTVM